VPANEDLLFGKIAVAQKFCTQAHIDECTRLQGDESSPPPLGELLLYYGHITPEQHAKVLEIQKQNLQEVEPLSQKRKESLLFGKIAVREQLATEAQVNECLRLQAEEGEQRTLGEIMVARGVLSAEQVKGLLGKQNKKLMKCPACNLTFTVLTLSEAKQASCPRCKGPLQERKPTDTVRVDAEFATQTVRVVKSEVPAGERPVSRVFPKTERKVKVSCVICDHKFEGPLDATGRVRCPSCQTSFTPK
jgi:hypothetical protein